MKEKRLYLVKNLPDGITMEDFATYLYENDSIAFDIDNYDLELIASGCATDIIKITFFTKQSEEVG